MLHSYVRHDASHASRMEILPREQAYATVRIERDRPRMDPRGMTAQSAPQTSR